MFNKEELACIKLYEFIEIKKEPIYFGKLVTELNIPAKEVSRIENKLMDLCMIDAKWITIDNKWVRIYQLSRCYSSFFESIYNASIGNQMTKQKLLKKE